MDSKGVRVNDGTATFDFVICYECGHLMCYEEDKTVAYTEAGGSSNVLDALLLAAHVPAETTPEKR